MARKPRKPLALFPGLLADGYAWWPQTEQLSDIADCRIADFGTQNTIEAMARSALSRLPDRFNLAGWSMGGYVACEVMRQAPERVSRLALIDTQPRRDTAEQADRRQSIIDKTEQGGFDDVVSEFPRINRHRRVYLTWQTADRYP